MSYPKIITLVLFTALCSYFFDKTKNQVIFRFVVYFITWIVLDLIADYYKL